MNDVGVPLQALVRLKSFQLGAATAGIGGLVSSTLLTLFLLPVLYEWMFEHSVPATEETPRQ
ncbi:MAG TPA: hypothetical protein VF456_27080 [Vicinamibacterales bacterium]